MSRVPSVGLCHRPAVHVVVLLLCAALWLACAPTRACAEEIGTRRNLVFSAERLFGVYFDHTSYERNNLDVDNDSTVIGLGWAGNPTSALVTPRLGIDFFLGNAFTLGGSLGFYSGTTNDYTITSFLLAFRAGYALRLGHSVTLWPRGGFSYVTTSGEDSARDNYTFALTVDAPFVFSLTEGFAITLGPTFDLGFLAEYQSFDATQTVFGLMFGLSGWTNL
jgi:hypothetical protein